MALEARALRAAAAADVPVPGLVADSDDPTVLGTPFLVMERVDGETIPRRILRDEAYADVRPRLAAQCGRVLARIHSIPLAAVPGLVESDPVEEWRTTLDGFGEPHPAFELGLRWLDANRPPIPAAPTVVHGDFRNGNLIVGGDGIRSVLDWELVHAGDPVEDLAWLCVKAWRFGAVHKRVGGFGDVDDLLDAYESESGRTVAHDVLQWWEVLCTLKWGVMCIAQRWTHSSGFVRSVELAAIGRRVCENEWDVLDLLPSPWGGT
jgi:aminoglycoside phosphotransferase (APT) family kinase protein